MANEVLKYLSELYRLVTVQDDYTTASQISAVVCNMESLLFPCNGVAPHGSDLDVYMSNIFNPDNGLPAFITKYFHVKTIRPCFDLMFGLILKLLLEYNRRVVQYVAIIKDVCMKAILSGDTTAQCKAKCYACLEKIITSLPGNFSLQSELNAEVLTNQLFNHLAMSRSKLQTTDVHSIYTIFGLLGKDFSSELCAPDKLIRAVCNELNSKEVKAGTAKIKIVESCLTALSNLLSNPEFKSLVLANSSHQSKIYSALKSTLVPNKRVHTAFRACLKLFADHTDVFSSLLIPEYALWHSQLTELLSNFEGEEDNRAIEEALDKFYVHVATFVSEQGGIQSVAIYKYFMEYFEKEMASLSTLRSTNVSGRNKNKLTIKGLSRFVECNVAGNDASRQHLATMFHAFLKRTLYLSLELQKLEQSSLESNARLVSHYVFLLSHLLAKVTTQVPSTRGTSTQVPGTQGGAGTLGSGTQGISSRESGIPGSSSQRISTKRAINTEDIFTQDPTTQGISTQGVGTQGTSTQRTGNQGPRTLGTSTQGPGTSGTGTQKASTQGISTGTQGFITQGPSTQVSTQSWNSFLSICLNLVSLYPRLDYRTAAEVSSELTQSLVSLWKKCECDGAVNGLIREFVYQSVIQTCSHDLAFDADNLPNQSLITYRAYLPLWRHLLSRTETLCDDSSFGDVIVNELMTSLLIFCHKLDLGANLKPDSELSNSTFLPSLSHAYLGDPASHLSPSNQADLTLFTNLVDFYTDLLTKQGAYTGRPPNTTLPPNSDSENSALPLNSAENSGLPPNFDPENAALPLNTTSSVRPMNTTSGNITLPPNSGNTTLSPNAAFLPLNSTENPVLPINTTGNLASNFASPDRGNSPPILSAGSARVVAVLSEIVGASMRHPVVSGLYSLSGLMLRLARAQGCFEDPALVKHLSPVLESYLDQVIHMSINQQHQLRFVCLSLILATPLCFIRPVLPRLVQPFKIIFELGLNDLDLAETGMSVLTYWVSHLSPHTMADFIAPLLPCMNPYLKSRDSVRDAVFYSETDRDILLSRSNTRSNKLAHIKKKKYIESYEQTSQLRNVQTSIVYFLSLLDSNLASQTVSREGNRENLSEACSQRLLFNVPYVTAKIPIYLDVFMDRIISLGSSSSNRRMRVSACEFLHSTTLLLLGNNKQDGSRKGSERDEMFEKMFPVLIKLGCDSDILIRQLFADLSVQMMHYYSSEIQLCTSHAQFVITTLMECITQDSDTELRSFASRLLLELIVWSRKQSKSADLVRDTKLNMAAVVKQIEQFCVHPHPSKRIGAAIAFNSIYKILREEPQFIDKHWLELFYYFINNLALCTSPGDNQILCESINHLSRVVKEKSQMFTKPNASRSKPNRFESLTLRSFLEYLSENLTRSNAFLRSAARKIVTTLSPHCAEFAMETELPRIQKLLESQLEDVSQLSEKDVSHLSEKDVFQLSEDIRVLNIALENELWLLNDFKDHTKTIVGLLLSPDSKLLITINRVLKQLNTASEGSITDSKRCVNERVSPNSVAGLSTLIVNLLKLTVKLDGNTLRALLPDGQQIESSIEDKGALLSDSAQEDDPVLSGSVQDDPTLPTQNSSTNQIINGAYFRLVAKCLFEPYSYHLNSEQLKELKWIMDRVLCDKCRSVDEIAKPLFEIIYRDYIQVDKMLEQIMEPYRMRQNRVDASQSFYLEAVMLIQKSGLFPYYIECINSDMVDLMVLTLFESSQEYAELSVDIAQYSRLVLEFISANSPDMRKLFECLVDEEMYSTFSSRPITKGAHFFNLHRPMLTQLLFRSHPDQLASLLLTELSDQKLCILTHLVQTLTGPKRDLDNTFTLLSNSGAAGVFFKTAVLSHWSRLVAYRGADDQWLSMLSNITHVKSHAGYLAEFDQVAEWFCQRLESPLLGPPDLLHYLKLLPSFLPNTISPSFLPNPVESRLLDAVRTILDHLAASSQSGNDSVSCDSVLVFSELLRAVPRCLNWALFKLLAEFYCRYSVQCEADKRDNPLDLESCISPLLSQLGPAHHKHLLRSIYSLLTAHEPPAQPNTAQQSSTHLSSAHQSSTHLSTAHQSSTHLSTAHQSSPYQSPARMRYALLHSVFLPILRESFRTCSARSVGFYEDDMMAAILEYLGREVDGEGEVIVVEEALVMKLVHVRIMEGILQVPKSELPDSLAESSKQVMKYIYSHILKSNSQFPQSAYASYLNIQLHTAAYVVTCVWICNTSQDLALYRLLFKEEPRDNKFIFRHFLDLEHDYNFPLEFSVLPKEKKMLTGIRSNQKSSDEYKSSIDIFSSSLADDVTRHDFTSTKMLVPSTITSSNQTVTLELDEINRHDAMQVLTAVLNHLMENVVTPDSLCSAPEKCTWFDSFLSCLEMPGQDKNVRVWLIKLVINCADLFQYFADRLYPALFRIIASGILGSHMNYFLNDLLLVMLRWHSTSLPPPEIVHDFLAFIFQLVPNPRPAILKYNLEMIRNMVALWKPILSCHQVPHNTLLTMLSGDPLTQYVAMKLAEILVSYDLPPYDGATEQSFVRILINLYRQKDPKSKGSNSSHEMSRSTLASHSQMSTVLASVTGGLLRLFHSNGEAGGVLQDNCRLEEFVRLKLPGMLKHGEERFLNTLYFVSLPYPAILDGFLNELLLLYGKKLPGVYQEYCLNMIGSVYTRNKMADMWTQLKQIGVLNILDNKQHELLLGVLKLVNAVKVHIDSAAGHNILSLVRSVAGHVDSNNPLIRTQVYEFIYYVYIQWLNREGGEEEMETEEGEEWGSVCKEVVLKGLIDEDQSLQDKNYALLSVHYQNTPPAALLTQLFQDLYLPSMESHLLSFVSYFLLDNTRNSPDYASHLFPHPLEACNYREHRLLLSYRHKNLTYAPLFINSLASQVLGLSQATGTVGQFSTPGPSSGMGGHRFHIRATDTTLEFEPTFEPGEDEAEVSNSDDVFLVPSAPSDTSQTSLSLIRNPFFKLSRRFVRNAEHLKREAISRHSSRNWKRRLLLKEKPKQKSSQVSLTRSYRTGDFPDVQIPYSSVLDPLRVLCNRDAPLGRLLVQSLFVHLARDSAEFTRTNVESFKQILGQGMNDPHVTSLILEIFSEQSVHCDVTNIAKTSGLIYHGILLTENKLLIHSPHSDKLVESAPREDEGESARKIIKLGDEHVISACHTELIDLYKSIDEFDIINGILAQQNNSDLKKALDAEQNSNYRKARKHYQAALDSTPLSILHDSYYSTFHWLSQWEELETALEEKVEGEWNRAWLDPCLMKHLLRAQSLKAGPLSDSFLAAFKSWTESNATHFDSLKLHHSQSTALLFLLTAQYPQASSLAELSLSQQLTMWSSGADQLDALSVTMETALVANSLRDPSRSNVAKLTHVWDLSRGGREELATLEMKVTLRNVSLAQMSAVDHELRQNLCARNISNALTLIDAAIGRNQFYFARAHLNRLNSNLDDNRYGDLIRLYASRVELLSCDGKLDRIVDVWTRLGHPEDYERGEQLKIDFYKHVHDLGSKLLVCLHNDSHSHVLNESLRNSFHDILGSYGVDLDSYGDYDMRQIQSCVFGVVVDGLRKTIVENSASELADDAVTSNASAYLALAEFIRTHARVSPEFPADAAFIESLLRATACGALKARQLFPLLLQLPGLADHSALFRERSGQVPAWMFLLWLNQILAYLDQDIGPLLLPIVQRIATEYPSAVKLPFNINAERYSANPALVALIDQLKFSAHESKLYGSLALCTLPGTVLRCHLEHIVTMDKTNLGQVNQAVSAMNSDCFSLKPDLNDAVFEFCKKYRRAVSDGIQAVTASRSVDKLHRVLEDVRKNEKTKRNWELKQVSRYLSSYGSGGDEQGLEIPGQYSGLICPVPRHHVKISGFKSTIRVMQSLKRPVQIIILGNDGQVYPWLIKYNEDLRSDERIQAMFSLYNTGLQTVRRCVNRELSLATYRVVSLSDNSGMIQWVPNTRVLGELYQTSGLSKAWLTQHLGAPYQKFHMKFVSPNTPPHVAYETSMARRTRDEIISNFASVTNKLPKHAMREGLLSVAKSPMNRVRLRNNFVRSYACMCIAQYTLGIGDRHLENTLVCTETGRCVGIDFGYSFGVATQLLPIPELMPFRLTPHILAVNEPYGSQGLIRESMVHAMSCLRAHADVILCALQVFIQEPCSDWLVMLRRKIAREGVSEAKEQEEKGAAYMEWYPEAKIRVCELKLRGLPSTFIMNQELEFRSPSSFSVCARYVSGEVGSFRKKYEGRELLTVGDQVDCLLDHATDWGILGVTWAGWAPYV